MQVWLVYSYSKGKNRVTVHSTEKLPSEVKNNGPAKFKTNPHCLTSLFAPDRCTFKELEQQDPDLKELRLERQQEEFYNYKRDSDEMDGMRASYLSAIDKRTTELHRIAYSNELFALRRASDSTIHECQVDDLVIDPEWKLTGTFYT